MCGWKLRPPCELVVRSVLPAFRSLVAKRLIEKYRFSQVAAAEKLGTTQASISYYLYSKRGNKKIKDLEEVNVLLTCAKEVARNIVNENISPSDGILQFCNICTVIRDQNLICDLHREMVLLPKNCDICTRTK